MTAAMITLGTGFTIYLIGIYILFGFIGSISNSYYRLQQEYEAGRMFTLFMVFVGFCLIYVAGVLETQFAFLFFIAGGAAFFTGFAAEYEDKITKPVHFAGSAVLILSTGLGIGLNFQNWSPIILTGVGLLIFVTLEFYNRRTKDMIRNDVYWFEVYCFVLLIIGLIAQ